MRALLGLTTAVLAIFATFNVAGNYAAAYDTFAAVKAEVTVSDQEQEGFEDAQALFAETLKKPYFDSDEYKAHLKVRADVYGSPEPVTRAQADDLRKQIEDALIYPWFLSEGSKLAERQAKYQYEYSQRDPGLDHTLRLLVRACQEGDEASAGDDWLQEGGFDENSPKVISAYAKGLDDIQAQAGDACKDYQ